MTAFSSPASLIATSLAAGCIGVASLFLLGCNASDPQLPPPSVPAEAIQAAVGDAGPQELVLVKFGAPWCGPCRQVDKELASLEEDVRVVAIDVDEAPDVAAQFGIQSIPRMFLVRNGEVLADELGFHSKSELRDWVADFQ
ncbi:thioredoxin family protein [Rhodopirellula halodulae]|uniref:thioredoxin family protein n=1 Tax=Rhodopirellula halodulae TaxID=2894198 RepID=UPI001E2DBDE6|nr:thioredoxin family protein [Rhodopirellula sp. JC737]MCC9654413.1 thioredoxin family protein [Rhodopirellula sp. JC737]